jgi:pimeloyl-ACP methyl ester carboxylesterase
MHTAPTKKTVITEGAHIYCELRGNGPLLLLITGAMGDAGFYSSTAELLADRFTVVCYDRRCNSRSSGDRTCNMRVGQQARDVTSIIRAMADKSYTKLQQPNCYLKQKQRSGARFITTSL